jgi:hypothetical protein
MCACIFDGEPVVRIPLAHIDMYSYCRKGGDQDCSVQNV